MCTTASENGFYNDIMHLRTYVHTYVRTVKQSSTFNCGMEADSTLLHNHADTNRHAYVHNPILPKYT